MPLFDHYVKFEMNFSVDDREKLTRLYQFENYVAQTIRAIRDDIRFNT